MVIGKVCPVCSLVHKTGGSTLLCYEKYLMNRLAKDEEFSRAFYEECLGQTLGCFCKPNPCHTDIMIKILEKPLSLSKEEIDKVKRRSWSLGNSKDINQK